MRPADPSSMSSKSYSRGSLAVPADLEEVQDPVNLSARPWEESVKSESRKSLNEKSPKHEGGVKENEGKLGGTGGPPEGETQQDGTRKNSREAEGTKQFLKIETVKFLQAIDQYLKGLQINSEKEITSNNVIEALSMRLDPVEATLAKTLIDIRSKKNTSEFLERVRANENWKKFTAFVDHLIELLRQLWIALRKPLYAPIPYELLLNSTLRTEIDLNFKHEDSKFCPNDLENFLQETDGKRLRKKIVNLIENKETGKVDRSPDQFEPLDVPEAVTRPTLPPTHLGKKRILKDVEKPRKHWASEMLRLMTSPDQDESAPGLADETNQDRVRKLNERQLMHLMKRNYIACDAFEDCSTDLRRELLAMRRRNKLRLWEQMRKDHNTLYLKLMREKIGFEVDGFVQSPVDHDTEVSTRKSKGGGDD